MGNLEKELKKRTRNKNLQKIILGSVAVAGVMSVALVAPNAIQALIIFGLGKNKRQKEIINRSRDRLIEHGLLEKNEQGYLSLTSKGKAKLDQLELRDYKIKKPKRWDKKWRVLIFDIPEKRKSLREKVRLTLTTIGFMRLQDSVWIYPYDCEDFVTLLKADFKIGKDILYMIVDSLEYDKPIKKSFDLE